MNNGADSDQLVIVGHVAGVFGVKGWLKIYSETDPVQNILKYKPWLLQKDGRWQEFQILQGKKQGKGVVAHLEGYDDRDIAAELKGCTIAIKREQLPKTRNADEFYWIDLENLRVENLEGFYLGDISHLFETGSNDVIVVQGERERYIPFIREQVVIDIDLDKGLMVVDWDPEF